MGLLSPGQVASLDPDAFVEAARRIGEAGVGRRAVAALTKLHGLEARQVASLIDELEQAMEDSPVPQREWPSLEALFGTERLARLVGVSPSSVRRYRAGLRTVPDDGAARLHFLAMIVADLAGSYNDVGIRRWFERQRTQLGGRAPLHFLSGDWKPDDPGPRRVRELARALIASHAT